MDLRLISRQKRREHSIAIYQSVYLTSGLYRRWNRETVIEFPISLPHEEAAARRVIISTYQSKLAALPDSSEGYKD
jgi:hypothetical protein